MSSVTRRTFLQLAGASLALAKASGSVSAQDKPLEQFDYSAVSLQSELHNRQFENTHSILMGLSDDALLKPFRLMAGQDAPGEDIGGWYRYDPKYDWHTFDAGFAPSATFGQWISALSRAYAIHPDPQVRDKVIRLNRLYAQTISPDFYSLKNRFPAYCYDKLVCGLIDAHQYVHDPDALRILNHTTDTALPHLPGHAVEQGTHWRPNTDESYTWDESYTMPENLFLAYQRGAGDRYRKLGEQYLHNSYFDPLAAGQSDLEGLHAYSHVNSLCSAMQAYLTLGSRKHLLAAKNGFDFVRDQSFATGGWGPDEKLHGPQTPDIAASLTKTHSSFETPCGAYAHFKLTRYLLRVTRDSQYGDSMERVMYNTILGAKPLQSDGRTFYYSDYNYRGRKVYSPHRWPCCSGTMPQIATDYGISSYFRDPQGIYVNLYIPSQVRWQQNGSNVALTQTTNYPFESAIELSISASTPCRFDLHLRIPAWAEGASVRVNDRPVTDPIAAGQFAVLHRQWRDGDRVLLELPLRNRLEELGPKSSNTVALLNGPLVLFPITDSAPKVTRQQLLAARKTGKQTWQAEAGSGPLQLLPFLAIEEESYSTYLLV